MSRKFVYILVGIAFVFFLISLFIFLRSSRSAEPETATISTEQEPVQIEMPEFLQVKLFFLTENSRYFVPVEGEIESSPVREDIYKRFVNLLLIGREGYITPIPEGLRLRTLFYVDKRQLVILDFSEELINHFPSGTSSELEFIYFLVDNLCYNFKEISMVKFMVAGNEYKTISGHLDIADPFYPDFSYIRD